MNKIKFLWHRYWLRHYYDLGKDIEEGCDCGTRLLEDISPTYVRARARYNHHLNMCRKYDRSKS